MSSTDEILTVKAKKIRSDCEDGVGDTIRDLDNGYVYSADDDGTDVKFILHDGDGGEMHFTCHRDVPITIKRGS